MGPNDRYSVHLDLQVNTKPTLKVRKQGDGYYKSVSSPFVLMNCSKLHGEPKDGEMETKKKEEDLPEKETLRFRWMGISYWSNSW